MRIEKSIISFQGKRERLGEQVMEGRQSLQERFEEMAENALVSVLDADLP